MTQVQGITDDASQIFTILLSDGSSVQLTLTYKPLQIGWFLGVTYGDFAVNVVRVTNSYNVLSQFSKLIPFGIACFTQSGQDPLFQEDFASGNASLCLLDETDLSDLETYLGSKT